MTEVAPSAPTVDVFVSVGTDHHPFDRIINWIGTYSAARTAAGKPISVVVQSGTSKVQLDDSIESHDLVPYPTMVDLMSRATVVVSHGGPATIMDARDNGRRPVVVPRDPELGEHVDGHQQRFARFLNDRNQVTLAEEYDDFEASLDAALADPSLASAASDSATVDEAVEEVGRLVDRAVFLGERPGKKTLASRFRRRPQAELGSDQYRVLFATSHGGHLAQCLRLAPWTDRHERRWVTFDTLSVRSALEGEEAVWAHYPTTRHAGNLVKNTWLALQFLRRERIDVIVSTGAGVAVPFFWLSRLFGIVTVYIEVYDRIDSATLTGRMVQRVTDLLLVQWPEQLEVYPEGTLVGKLL